MGPLFLFWRPKVRPPVCVTKLLPSLQGLSSAKKGIFSRGLRERARSEVSQSSGVLAIDSGNGTDEQDQTGENEVVVPQRCDFASDRIGCFRGEGFRHNSKATAPGLVGES